VSAPEGGGPHGGDKPCVRGEPDRKNHFYEREEHGEANLEGVGSSKLHLDGNLGPVKKKLLTNDAPKGSLTSYRCPMK